MCLQTTLESVWKKMMDWTEKNYGDMECIPEGRVSMRKATLARTFQTITTQTAKFIGPTWGPPGSYRPQIDPMLAPRTLLSGEMSSRDVYPQIVEAPHDCKATVVITGKVRPCHVEPYRPATGSYNLFLAQLAARVVLSVLVLYGHISAIRTKCERHYSGSVVAETLYVH